MGGSSSTAKGLDQAQRNASLRQGKVAISGRYHKLPRRMEDEYKLDSKVLGTGYNGSVFLAEHRETKLKYAVKGFHLHGLNSEKREELESEAEIFLSMDHPHVARLVAVYEDEKMLNLVRPLLCLMQLSLRRVGAD
ncbi:unnamed protein product [Prorocentrum cordatum]|uniref:Protein kinase domain-containing protein n=1 Tax=Prorocentrum cordatum TaxID=2364126 RepID=A0ABN9WYT5_9DINO|nr:unnamed protein product [Polarella glacialis]